MAKQFLGTRYQSFKNDGTVNAAGWVYFYEIGTSTEKITYSDSDLGTPNASPVVLNSAGAADIWYDGDADVSVYDSTGTLIDSYSNINPAVSSSTLESSLIPNGSFEDGGSTTPTSWVRSTPPALGSSAQDLDSAHGLYSWKFTSGGNGAGNLITTDYFNVAVGRTFNVIWQMKSSVADVRNLVEVVWYDDASAELSASAIYDNSTTNPTSWTTKFALATPVANAVRAKLRVTGCHSSDATPGSTWFDGVQVTESFLTGADIWFKEGTDIASASTTEIWTTDGNTAHITGAVTITSLGTAPRAGLVKWIIFDGALTLTHGANLNLPGSANITTAAGDFARVYADTTTQHDVQYFKANGQAVVTSTAAQGASLVLISSTTAASSATIDITSGITSTYDEYEIHLVNVIPATDDVNLWMRTDADAGASFDAADYLYSGAGTSSLGTTLNYSPGAVQAQIVINSTAVGGSLDNGAGSGICGVIKLFTPSSTVVRKKFQWQVSYQNNEAGANHIAVVSGSGAYTGTTALINAVRFLMSSGNIASGSFHLYGVKKA